MSTRALHVEINWAHGPATRHLIVEEDLNPPRWDDWLTEFTARTRPSFVPLGREFVFHTQTVQSIELLEAIEHEEG